MKKDRTFGESPPAPLVTQWYTPIDTFDGPARLRRFIPAQAFTQCVLFNREKIYRDTLGDVPLTTDKQLEEVARFVGRNVFCADRDVHRYQGERGWQYLATVWPQSELLRVAKQAAIFQGLRTAESSDNP